MPILGIYASQVTGHLYTPANSYESIATVTVGSGGSSSISFTSIPSTYKHLQLRGIVRTTDTAASASDGNYIGIRFNSDTGANYVAHNLYGNGASAVATSGTGLTEGWVQRFPNANATASNFGVLILDILDYANTSKTKVLRELGGYDNNGGGRVYLQSDLWNSTTAINSITFTPENSSNFAQYSSIALYGVKG